jgi:homocysteine S-methyltransferase
MDQGSSPLHDIQVLDGGLATELEFLGARIDGPLWSAHALEEDPERLLAVHRAYIEAGAQCIALASYQVSRMGYAECGLPPERADAALLRSVELARQAVAQFPACRVLVAGSLGPYGAALHNGAEYTGNYTCSYADLVRFHRERIEVFAHANGSQDPDLLAFETFPSLDEAQAVCEALAAAPNLHGWFSFSCGNDKTVSHGEPLRECAALLDAYPQILAIGVNCVPPRWVTSLVEEIRSSTTKPIVAYPNSGEGWDAKSRSWTGTTDTEDFGRLAASWFAAGVQIVGGCCRTRPAHIRAIASVARAQASA